MVNGLYSAPVQADGTLGAFVPRTGLRFCAWPTRTVQAVSRAAGSTSRTAPARSTLPPAGQRPPRDRAAAQRDRPAGSRRISSSPCTRRPAACTDRLRHRRLVERDRSRRPARRGRRRVPAGHPDLALLPVGEKLVAMTPTTAALLEAFASDIRLAGDELQAGPRSPDLPLVLRTSASARACSTAPRSARNNAGVWSEVGVSAPGRAAGPAEGEVAPFRHRQPAGELPFPVRLRARRCRASRPRPASSRSPPELDGLAFAVQPNTDLFIHTFGQHLLEFHGTTPSLPSGVACRRRARRRSRRQRQGRRRSSTTSPRATSSRRARSC